QPHAADAGRTDLAASQPQFVRHALRTVRWIAQGVVEDLLFDFGRHAIGMGVAWAAFLFDQGSDAADLEGTTNLVEGVAVITHYLAGLGHVAEFFGQLQQGQFPLGTLRERSHLGTPDSWWFGDYQSIPETRVAAPGIDSVRCWAHNSQLSEKYKISSEVGLDWPFDARRPIVSQSIPM